MLGQLIEDIEIRIHSGCPEWNKLATWKQDSNQLYLIFNQKNRFQSQIDPTFPVGETAKNQKTARSACQAVHFRVVGGIGLEPVFFLRKTAY